MDDAALVRQVLAGHSEAYGELVTRWAGRISALCHARVGRVEVADELAQEALLRGLEELTWLASPERFGPWLAGIAINTSRDWLKAKQTGQVPFSALGPNGPQEARSPVAPPDARLEQQDELRRLMAEVEALPEDLRTVLILYYYQDLTYREIAHLLDVSAATVNARLTKARALLRARLKAPVGPSPRKAAPLGPPPAPPDSGPGTY
jgi:RNA polymerase sigma-70 factor (ECF subfamily)